MIKFIKKLWNKIFKKKQKDIEMKESLTLEETDTILRIAIGLKKLRKFHENDEDSFHIAYFAALPQILFQLGIPLQEINKAEMFSWKEEEVPDNDKYKFTKKLCYVVGTIFQNIDNWDSREIRNKLKEIWE